MSPARKWSAADNVVYEAMASSLRLALAGDGFVTGGTPSEKAPTPAMTVSLASGSFRIAGTTYTLSAQDATITAAHATLTRTDLISVDSTGTATVTAGTAAAAPGSGVSYADPPDLPANHIPIALVEVAAGVTSILDARIVDIRSIIPLSKDLIDAKGDLLVGTASDTIARKAVGADDTILMADSTQSDGVKWQAPATTAEIADSAAAEAAGTSDTWARGDHVHAHGSGYLPDAHHNRSHDHATAGDGTALAPATLTIPSAAAPAQTAEGSAVWDSDDDKLTVGTGASRKTLANEDAVVLQTLADAKGDIIVATADNTFTRLAVGSNSQVLTADSAEATGVKWASALSITTAEADLGADVAMATANTFYDGPSVSLAAGTWFIVGTVTVVGTANGATVTAKLWDGTTVESSAEDTASGADHGVAITLSGIVVLGGTTTYKISVTSNTASQTLKAATPRSGSGNHASHIRAIKVA